MQRKSTLCAAREALTALKCSNFEASTGICIDSHNSRILTCACYSNPPNTYFALTPQILTKHLHLNSPNNHAIFEDPPKCCDAVALCARNKTPKRPITDPPFFSLPQPATLRGHIAVQAQSHKGNYHHAPPASSTILQGRSGNFTNWKLCRGRERNDLLFCFPLPECNLSPYANHWLANFRRVRR